jgi:hypothetical protein
MGQREIDFMNASLTSTGVRNFNKEVKPLLEDLLGLVEHLNQFIGPNLYSWAEIMSIMNILFREEERNY